jgi:hypothetical protein
METSGIKLKLPLTPPDIRIGINGGALRRRFFNKFSLKISTNFSNSPLGVRGRY